MNPDCKRIRQDILKISNVSGHGHVPSCFSVIEILYALYHTINHDPKKPSWSRRDIFVLSKGHASLGLYCVLAHFGYFDIKNVYSFGSFTSDFGCHMDRIKIPGIEASTGSLGHGIAIAVGMALGLKIKKEDSRRVYTLIGDGEANEGSVWEAIMVATNLGLNNLTIIYDNNLSHSRGLQIQNPAQRLGAFGCEAVEVDGHDISQLKKEILVVSSKPRAIIAHTKKGFGSRSLISNHYEWHRKSPTSEELKKLLRELDEETV
ncbi:MAG: transketolase [Candidatus Omnitrophota bacterium]